MFELYQTESGAWRFRFKNKQDKTFLMSENYTSKDGAENGIESIKKNASDEANLVKEVASDGRHYFNIKA